MFVSLLHLNLKNDMIQLDFFQSYDDLDFIRNELKCIKESSDKVRKGMFARHNELAKMMMSISERLEIIERNICKDTSHSLAHKSA